MQDQPCIKNAQRGYLFNTQKHFVCISEPPPHLPKFSAHFNFNVLGHSSVGFNCWGGRPPAPPQTLFRFLWAQLPGGCWPLPPQTPPVEFLKQCGW